MCRMWVKRWRRSVKKKLQNIKKIQIRKKNELEEKEDKETKEKSIK